MLVEERRSAVPVAMVSVVLFTFFAVARLVLWDESPTVMVASAAAIVIMASVFYLLIQRDWFPRHIGLYGLLAFIAADTLLALYVTGEARQTSNFVLVLVAVGFFILHAKLAAGFMVAMVTAWAIVMPRATDDLVHYSFSVGAAVVLAIVLGMLHRRVLFNATQAAEALARAREEAE